MSADAFLPFLEIEPLPAVFIISLVSLLVARRRMQQRERLLTGIGFKHFVTQIFQHIDAAHGDERVVVYEQDAGADRRRRCRRSCVA